MESLHEKVVKLTAEILKKSWTPEPGKVSPFSSGSSINDNQISDNHLEHYVQQDPKTPLNGAIANIFNSNLWTNGGETMTDKTLDVDSSTTPEQQYDNPGSSTTEPDPQSEIAITKSLEGEGTYSTTANTTEQAPAAGETTEPVAKSDSCPTCGKEMTLCECAGMSKSDNDNDAKAEPDADKDDADAKAAKDAKKLKKAKKLIKKYKKAKKLVKAAKKVKADDKATDESKEDTMQKSIGTSPWQGAFSPNITRGL
jgi:hypothetical protein